jgi:hypothetical protein
MNFLITTKSFRITHSPHHHSTVKTFFGEYSFDVVSYFRSKLCFDYVTYSMNIQIFKEVNVVFLFKAFNISAIPFTPSLLYSTLLLYSYVNVISSLLYSV